MWCKAWVHVCVLERRKGEVSVLRDFEAAGEPEIDEEFGKDIAEIAEIAQYTTTKDSCTPKR